MALTVPFIFKNSLWVPGRILIDYVGYKSKWTSPTLKSVDDDRSGSFLSNPTFSLIKIGEKLEKDNCDYRESHKREKQRKFFQDMLVS